MPYRDKEKEKAYQKEYKKEYNIKNKQKVKEYAREYNAKNRQKINERRRKYRKEIDKICIICEKNFILKSNQPEQTKFCSIECRKQNKRNYAKGYKLKARVSGSDYYKKHLEYNKKYLSAYNRLESTKLKKYNKNDPIQKAKEIKRVNLYVSKRRKTDKLFKIKLNLRQQVFRILNKEDKKIDTSYDDLGAYQRKREAEREVELEKERERIKKKKIKFKFTAPRRDLSIYGGWVNAYEPVNKGKLGSSQEWRIEKPIKSYY